MTAMMAEHLFSIANLAAVLCWILLAAIPNRRWVTQMVAGTIVPAIFAVGYTAIIIAMFPRADGGFSTLTAVAALFANRWLLLAGWLHYLAFDLLIGTWEARDSVDRGVPRWVLVPCLLLTFLFGPTGWITYTATVRLLNLRAARNIASPRP
jgi:hypothetical protein